MLRTSNALLSIRISAAANRLIHYAGKLPLIGRAVPERLYGDLEAKKVFIALAWMVIVAWGLLGKAMYAGLLVALPVALWAEADPAADRLEMFQHIFLWLSFVAAGVSMATAMEPKKEKWVAVKLMRMAPAAYMRTHFAYRYSLFFLCYVPVLMLAVWSFDGHPLHGLALAAALTGWRLLCEYAHLWLFAKTGKIIIRDNVIVWAVIGISYAVAYLPMAFEWMPVAGQLLSWWPATLALVAAGTAAAFGLARYPGYRAAVDAAAKRDDPMIDMERMMKEARVASVKNDDHAYEAVPGSETDPRLGSGYPYLNRLFFARHRKFLIKPVYRRVAISFGLGLAGLLVLALFGNRIESNAVLRADFLAPYLPVVLSVFAIGEVVCKAMFYHCDSPLMRYAFYRKAAPIHYRLRLIRLTGLNMASGSALFVALAVVLAVFGHATVQDIIWLGITVLSLSVFFSVHHLTAYYVLQPYSTELNVRNPFYMIVTMGLTFFCWLCVFFASSAVAVAILTAVAAALYLAVGLLLVHRLGYRTFRVK